MTSLSGWSNAYSTTLNDLKVRLPISIDGVCIIKFVSSKPEYATPILPAVPENRTAMSLLAFTSGNLAIFKLIGVPPTEGPVDVEMNMTCGKKSS